MVQIRLKNSKSRRVEPLDPIVPGKVSMYVCGPTVYDRAHIGNARSAVVFDQLFRLLRHVYGPGNVTFVRNFTDVDDKINARAAEEGRSIGDLTAETAQWYLDDTRKLGVLDPTHMPRATEYIAEMVAMIEKLVEKGFAYSTREASNNPPREYVIADREAMLTEHGLFDVGTFDRYGDLSGRNVDDMIAGARVEVAPYKRSPMDFVLWKPSAGDEPGWDSPWGFGRPGWHIECSAMAKALLGDLFDIHGGGLDLQFPHHENERAQSCCANNTDEMANIWMHNEMLQVEGKKMSKSLGNFFTVRDLLDQGTPGEVIRFVMLSTHYGKPMDWTEKKREEAEKTLRKWASVARLPSSLKPPSGTEFKPDPEVVAALADDLNTPRAITRLHKMANDLHRQTVSEEIVADVGCFKASAALLGFLDSDPEVERAVDAMFQKILGSWSNALSNARATAMETKDFSAVDALKQALAAAGVEVRMSKEGVELIPGPNFDPSKLEDL